ILAVLAGAQEALQAAVGADAHLLLLVLAVVLKGLRDKADRPGGGGDEACPGVVVPARRHRQEQVTEGGAEAERGPGENRVTEEFFERGPGHRLEALAEGSIQTDAAEEGAVAWIQVGIADAGVARDQDGRRVALEDGGLFFDFFPVPEVILVA